MPESPLAAKRSKIEKKITPACLYRGPFVVTKDIIFVHDKDLHFGMDVFRSTLTQI